MYKTDKGKVVRAVVGHNSMHYVVEFASGGQLPACLKSTYTSEAIANQAIEDYLENNKKKTVKVAKA